MKPLHAFVVLLGCMWMLVGCWDRTEVNDIAIVLGVGLDLVDDKEVEVTVEIVSPKALGRGQGSSGGGGGGETVIRSGIGKTIPDAVSNLQEKFPRKIFWGHTKVIIFGEKLAKAGIKEHFDFFTRHPEPRLRAHMFVSKGKAKETIAVQPPVESSLAEVLRELAKSEILLDVTMKDFIQMIREDTHDSAILPMISILPKEEGMDPLQTISYINQTAILKQNKLIGLLNDRQTRGLLWYQNRIKQGTLTIMLEKKESISINLIRTHTKLIPSIKNGKWKITVEGTFEGDIIMNSSKLNILDPSNSNEIDKGFEKEVKSRMEIVRKKLQEEYKVDVIGFSEAFERKYPEEWERVKEKWDDIFPTIEVNYELKGYVRRPGMFTKPQRKTEKW